jgi:DNA-binding GntR family transcriptional regulator
VHHVTVQSVLAPDGLLETLRMAIYHGELTAGQRLVEAELATRFDASRSAVREALTLLSNEGLVVRERNRGAHVRPVSLDDAIEITQPRAVLEGLCAAKAAVLITAQGRRELRALSTTMAAAVRKNDILAYNTVSQQAEQAMREHLFSVADAHRQLAKFGPSPLLPPAPRR